MATSLSVDRANIDLEIFEDNQSLVDFFAPAGGSSNPGIVVDDRNRIVKISLPRSNLSGEIPSEIGMLTALRELNLAHNNLRGSIPAEIGNLTALTTLRLERNKLTGSIPVEIGNLTALTTLHLERNQFTGLIPAEIGNLAALERLHLERNQLTGLIPAEIGNLAALEELHLEGNQLTGSIPAEIGNLAALERLHLEHNQLTGSIPAEIGNLTALEELHLEGNQLTGSIPAEIGNLTALEELRLEGNQLTGSIPVELDNLVSLTALNLKNNNFKVSIPREKYFGRRRTEWQDDTASAMSSISNTTASGDYSLSSSTIQTSSGSSRFSQPGSNISSKSIFPMLLEVEWQDDSASDISLSSINTTASGQTSTDSATNYADVIDSNATKLQSIFRGFKSRKTIQPSISKGLHELRSGDRLTTIPEQQETITPEWVCLAFTTSSKEGPSPILKDDFKKITTQESINGHSVIILQSSASTRRILLEYDEKEVRQAMSAHFIFISLPVNSLDLISTVTQRLHTQLQQQGTATGHEELWIEICPSFEGICALHFSSTSIEFFYSIIRRAQELNLKPFPDYCMLGLTTCTVDGGSWDYDSWTSPFGIHIPRPPAAVSNAPNGDQVKIGVIDLGFKTHHCLSNSCDIGSRGTHGSFCAGIIGSISSEYASMSGVVHSSITAPDRFQLHYYSVKSPGGPPSLPEDILNLPGFSQDANWKPMFSEYVNTFVRCKTEGVALLTVSLSWRQRFDKQSILNMLSAVGKILDDEHWNCHFVVSAGNDNVNLDDFQVDENKPGNEFKVDFFSALAIRKPHRVTIIGASDMFGHRWSLSNYGTMVALAAPGEYILSTIAPDSFGFNSGTSFSAPLVTGAVGVMKHKFPAMNYDQIIKRFVDTADIHFTMDQSRSKGRLHLGRAMELEEFLITTTERELAYPSVAKFFTSYNRSLRDEVLPMTADELLEWYDADGRQKAIEISYNHLQQAISHMLDVADNALPILLNAMPRPELVEVLQQRRAAIVQEWVIILETMTEGSLPTAFLRDIARIKFSDIIAKPGDLMAMYSVPARRDRLDRYIEDANKLVPHADAMIKILGRAKFETELALQVLDGVEAPFMVALWKNEMKWIYACSAMKLLVLLVDDAAVPKGVTEELVKNK
eukprot:gene31783-41249_t